MIGVNRVYAGLRLTSKGTGCSAEVVKRSLFGWTVSVSGTQFQMTEKFIRKFYWQNS